MDEEYFRFCYGEAFAFFDAEIKAGNPGAEFVTGRLTFKDDFGAEDNTVFVEVLFDVGSKKHLLYMVAFYEPDSDKEINTEFLGCKLRDIEDLEEEDRV